MDKTYSIIRVDCDDKGRTIAFSTESVYASSDLAWEHMNRRHYTLLRDYGVDKVSIAKRYDGKYDIRLSYGIGSGVIETAWLVQENVVHHSFITARLES